MFEQLREKFGHKPEAPPTDEQLVSQIDRYVVNELELSHALESRKSGAITDEELEFFKDLRGLGKGELTKLLARLGLWERSDGSSEPSMEEIVAIREKLVPGEENRENVANIEDYRRI